MAKNTEQALLNGLTTPNTLENSITIIYMERGFILGQTAGSMKASGETIKCMVRVLSLGLTVENMWENMLMIKNKATENLFGQMVDHTKGTGREENSMERVCM